MSDEPKHEQGWLIHKAGRGWYRPKAQGYTSDTAQAGRYSYDDAMSYSHPNGWDGPRDEITIKHESDLPAPAVPDDVAETAKRLREATFTKGRMRGGVGGQTIEASMRSTFHEVSAWDLDQAADTIEAQAAELARLTDKLELERALTDGAHRRARAADAHTAERDERLTKQYHYKIGDTCWHDEGTGPLPNVREYDDYPGTRININWRIKTAEQPAPDAVADAWQAMDTAPTDGTKFAATNGRLTFTTYALKYYEKFPHEEGGPIYKTRWTAEDGSSVWPWNPTHWMPLPVAKGHQP